MERNKERYATIPQPDEITVKKVEDDPFETLHSVHRIYQQLYDEYVGCMKSENFRDLADEDEDED